MLLIRLYLLVDDIISGDHLKLRDLKIFSNHQLKILQDYSILTAEQFVGACATPEGFSGIMNALNITQDTLNNTLKQVKDQLPPNLAELLSKPIPFPPPLGARKPKKKRKPM